MASGDPSHDTSRAATSGGCSVSGAARTRPCLQYQIKRCTAPCVGLIDAAAYAEDVDSARLFLDGRSDDALRRLTGRMQAASEKLQYELAAVYRDQIQSLSRVGALPAVRLRAAPSYSIGRREPPSLIQRRTAPPP